MSNKIIIESSPTESNNYNSPMGVGNNRASRSAKRTETASRTAIQILLTVMAIIWVLPLSYIILHSFRGDSITVAFPTKIFPQQWSFDAYIKLFGGKVEAYGDEKYDWINFGRWWINTLIIAIFSCVISTFYVIATSYAFSRMRFRSRKPMMNLILILGMFPGFLGMIAVYNILRALGLNEGILKSVALVLVYSGGAGMGYYIAKGFFDTIPKALDEAARIDGANRAQILWKIILPSSKPIIIYTVLTSFISPWIDFVFVRLICMGQYEYGTVSLGLWNMLSLENFNSHWILFCAGATLVALPITVLFMFMQKYYVSGVTGGAVKG